MQAISAGRSRRGRYSTSSDAASESDYSHQLCEDIYSQGLEAPRELPARSQGRLLKRNSQGLELLLQSGPQIQCMITATVLQCTPNAFIVLNRIAALKKSLIRSYKASNANLLLPSEDRYRHKPLLASIRAQQIACICKIERIMKQLESSRAFVLVQAIAEVQTRMKAIPLLSEKDLRISKSVFKKATK